MQHDRAPSDGMDLDWLLRRYGLEVIASAVAPVRHAIELELEPVWGAAPRARAGGDPDLPSAAAWPMRGGAALPFLLQLDLTALDRAHGAAYELPRTGLLSVFGDGEQFAVLHVGGALAVVPTPDGTARAPVHAIRHRAHLTLPDPTSAALAAELEALRKDELRAPRGPAIPSLRLETRAWWEPEPAAPDPFERYGELRAAIEGTAHIGHRLLGHAISVHDDAVAQAGADRLLLQLSSSWKLGWKFARDGVLYLCIDEDDLRARRFERVVSVCQR